MFPEHNGEVIVAYTQLIYQRRRHFNEFARFVRKSSRNNRLFRADFLKDVIKIYTAKANRQNYKSRLAFYGRYSNNISFRK